MGKRKTYMKNHKNNQFLEKQKFLARKIDETTPAIYASIGLALLASDVPADDVEYIFGKSLEILQNNDMWTLVKELDDRANICLLSAKQAKAMGYDVTDEDLGKYTEES